jgi:hypothetical protein
MARYIKNFPSGDGACGIFVRIIRKQQFLGSSAVSRFAVEVLMPPGIGVENDLAAVGRPDRAGFGPAAKREAASQIAREVVDPEIGIAGTAIRQGENGALAVRRDGEPGVLVRVTRVGNLFARTVQ